MVETIFGAKALQIGSRRSEVYRVILAIVLGLMTFGINAQPQSRAPASSTTDPVNSSILWQPSPSVSSPSYPQVIPTYEQENIQAINQSQLTGRAIGASGLSYRPLGLADTNFIDYFIKPDLFLGVTYNYDFQFYLSAQGDGGRQIPIPLGWYKMVIAVIRPSEDQSPYLASLHLASAKSIYEQYVTSARKNVYVGSSQIHVPVSLKFPNASSTAIRSSLYVEFIPLESQCEISNGEAQDKTQSNQALVPCTPANAENSDLWTNPNYQVKPPKTLAGFKPFAMSMSYLPVLWEDSGGGDLSESSLVLASLKTDDLDNFVLNARRYRFERRQIPAVVTPEKFAAAHHLNLLSLSSPLFTSSDKSVPGLIERLIHDSRGGTLVLDENYRPLTSALCEVFLPPIKQTFLQRVFNPSVNEYIAKMVSDCYYNPDAYYRVSRITHVYRFDPHAFRVASVSHGENFITSYTLSRTHSVDSSNAFSVTGLSLTGATFKLIDAFGMGLLGTSLTHTISWNSGSGETATGTAQDFAKLDYNLIGFQFPVFSYQRCLEIHTTDYARLGSNDGEIAHDGMYICDNAVTTPEDRPVFVPEGYAHVYEHESQTSDVDTFSPRSQQINVTLRGDHDISMFSMLMNSTVRPMGMDPSAWLSKVGRKLKTFSESAPSSDFGLVVNPVSFSYSGNEFSLLRQSFTPYLGTFEDVCSSVFACKP